MTGTWFRLKINTCERYSDCKESAEWAGANAGEFIGASVKGITQTVEKYKELRANDSGGIGRNSYRITVRQLESLIRLSEAIAKANCVEDVTDAMVIEAFNLLRMSIISVEKDDIEVDDEEGDVPAPADGNGDSPMAEGAANDEVAEDGTPAPRPPRTKITWEKYNKMMNLLARRINDDELTT